MAETSGRIPLFSVCIALSGLQDMAGLAWRCRYWAGTIVLQCSLAGLPTSASTPSAVSASPDCPQYGPLSMLSPLFARRPFLHSLVLLPLPGGTSKILTYIIFLFFSQRSVRHSEVGNNPVRKGNSTSGTEPRNRTNYCINSCLQETNTKMLLFPSI